MKYLTINDYDDPTHAINDCLKMALKIHRSFFTEISPGQKDQKYALYLLIGAGIDAAHLAFDFYSKTVIAPMLHLQRYLIEVRALAEYFIVDDSNVAPWFEGKYVSGRLTSRNTSLKEKVQKKAKIPFHFPDVGNLMNMEKSTQQHFEHLSKYCHPTIDAIRLGFTPHDRALPRKADLGEYRFGNYFLSPLTILIADVGRTIFTQTAVANEVEFLALSEYRVLFNAKSF